MSDAKEGILLDREGNPIGSVTSSERPEGSAQNAHWKSFVFMAGKDTRAQIRELGPMAKLGLGLLAPLLVLLFVVIAGFFMIGVGTLLIGGQAIRAGQRLLGQK